MWNSRKFILMAAALWSDVFHEDFVNKLCIILENFFQIRLWKKGREISGISAMRNTPVMS